MQMLKVLKDSFYKHVHDLFSFNGHSEWTLNVDPKKAQFGDITTNVALVIAQQEKKKPREVAQQLVETFKHESIEKVEIAGPGFINIFLKPQFFIAVAQELFDQKEAYFKKSSLDGKKINIEFVSANPTGPLHLGHGRGGIIGDVLANVLRFIGDDVTKEHYINDAGSQMNKLGMSLKIRCQQAAGLHVELPEEAYHGGYLQELAQQCLADYSDALTRDDEFFIAYGYKYLLAQLQDTLKEYGITFDVWFSEKTLHPHAIERALEVLQSNGTTYVQDGALWFKSTLYGDDKDRVLKKADGDYTYAAADAAYLLNKAERGFTKLIFVLGQDHHSYPKRLDGIRQALGLSGVQLDCIIYQLVSLKEDGQALRMSKRAGRIVGLQDVTEAVGADVARFFYLNRKADAHLDFDLALALKKTDENPVYYLQYAYVRMNAVLKKAQEVSDALHDCSSKDLAFLDESAYILIKKVAFLKELLEDIASNYQVHLLTYYLLELAALFHGYYHDNKIIDDAALERTRGRLALVHLVRDTMGAGLALIGVSRPDSM